MAERNLKTGKTLVKACRLLNSEELAEVLKWPFCVGEARKLVLGGLEKVAERTFGGDLWKFVEQAPALSINNFDRPAKRPVAPQYPLSP
jgi:hypothetical protein